MSRETKLDIIEIGRGYLGVALMSFLAWRGFISL